MGKLQSGLMNAVERKMHAHTIENENMDREIKTTAKKLDDDVEQAKANAKT